MRTVRLLEQLGWQANTDEELLLSKIAQGSWNEIDAISDRLGPLAVELLSDTLSDLELRVASFSTDRDKYRMSVVARALGRTLDVRAVEGLMVCLDRTHNVYPEIEREIRSALNELREANGAAVTALILARRTRKESVGAIVGVLQMWSWRAEDVPALLEALHDANPEVRYWSAFALRITKSRDAVDGLIEALTDKGKYSYSISPFITGIPDVGSYSDAFYVREAAATALKETGDPRAIEPLTRMLAEETDPAVRVTVEMALKSLH
jgi:HEAT repeat protein